MQNNRVMYLATVDKARNPKVRPFMYYLERDGKPYFCTSNKKTDVQRDVGTPQS